MHQNLKQQDKLKFSIMMSKPVTTKKHSPFRYRHARAIRMRDEVCYMRSLPSKSVRYAKVSMQSAVQSYLIQPLKGLGEPRTVSVSYLAFVPAGHASCGVALSYRASSPYGETLPSRIKGSLFVLPQQTPNSQLLTLNS